MKQNQTYFHVTYSNLMSYLFLSKIIKVFQWLSKSKFHSFMIKVRANYGNESKLDIFPWDILKSDITFPCSQNTKIFQWLLQFASFNFIAKLSTNNQNELKSSKSCANLTPFLFKWLDFFFFFLIKFISKMNSNCSKGKNLII